MADFTDILALTPIGSYVIYRENKDMMFRYEPNINRNNFELQMCIMPAVIHIQEMRITGFQTTGRLKDLYIPPTYIPLEDDILLMEAPTFSEQINRGKFETDGLYHEVHTDDTFTLHSKPGSLYTLYLDMTGHTTTGTIWNALYSGGSPINTPSYSSNLVRCQQIWAGVAEMFAPYDIDVTTEDQGTGPIIKDDEAGTNGLRVCIGGSASDWYGGGVGGVAFLGSWGMTNDTPVFVFPSQLSNNAKYIGDAAAHESGHGIGALSHDGRTSPSEEYHSGGGSGAVSWAPLMGNSYTKSLTHWSQGEYTNANNTEDDTALIEAQLGLRSATNDGTLMGATAFPAPEGDTSYTSGIIRTRTEVNTFSFSVTTTNTVTLIATPNYIKPQLDILLELLDDEGEVIASNNEDTELYASIVEELAAGTYYARVSGIGRGNPATVGQYSDYGSLGQYTLSLTKEGEPVPNILCISANGNLFCINY